MSNTKFFMAQTIYRLIFLYLVYICNAQIFVDPNGLFVQPNDQDDVAHSLKVAHYDCKTSKNQHRYAMNNIPECVVED